MRKILGLSFLSVFISSGLLAASGTAQPASILDVYKGGFKDDYPQELVRVRSYVLPVQSEIATLFGMQYGQGFLYPVTIRFDDGAPAVSENPYFYVQTKGTGPDFRQDVVVNVEAFAKHRSDWPAKESTLRGGFRYALTQVLLNDIAAGDADKALPLWAQEGLCVYASGNGEEFVKTAAERVRRSRVTELVGELNSPSPYLVPKDWALYYLAVKYVAVTGNLQAFVRDITSGQSAADTVRNSLNEEWPAFEEHVHAYALQALASYAMPEEDDVQTSSHDHSRR